MTIDLRSDTVTHPTPAMRKAMAEAEVGDDGWGDDPTVNELERRAASLMSKEAALFVASGTMGNLVSLLAQCERGDEVIVGEQSHILLNEVAGASALGGLTLRQLPNESDGTIDIDRIEDAIRTPGLGFPTTRLLCLENTHNRLSGRALTVTYTEMVSELAGHYQVGLHLDGARIFNAAIAQGVSAAALARSADSLSFCLSKGLSCPVGSVVCGTEVFIARARKMRRMLGGGMRQAGILAAAGLVALESMIERLSEDHENAKRLALGLAPMPHVRIDPEAVDTNIVIFEVENGDAQQLLMSLQSLGVKVSSPGRSSLRMVTHYGITAEDIDQVLNLTEKALQDLM